MQSVLFVCLGNICRSPLAQGIFEKQTVDLNLSTFYVADSAGTSAWHQGEKPHSGSLAVARRHGVSIEKQRSRPVHAKDAEIFDYIVAMDLENRRNLLTEFRFPEEKIFLMRDFAKDGKKGLSVPDPWGHGDDAFENVFSILDEAMRGFIEFLHKNTGNKI
ncbi:MAG: Low molecular weight protein-tyrosine-phosphatase YfkJ [Turneriella sp.]|nr:Low molecular weight protein-tyrosine-phosphatase YfkJ [Turneriella sp.]